MTVNPVPTATPRLRARSIARIPRHAVTFAALALVGGTAWQVAVLAPRAAHAAIRPVASAPAPALAATRHAPVAAAPVDAEDEDDQDDSQADDGQPEEPVLQQIPVTESPDPQSIDA
jgi:hypothetical protein